MVAHMQKPKMSKQKASQISQMMNIIFMLINV